MFPVVASLKARSCFPESLYSSEHSPVQVVINISSSDMDGYIYIYIYSTVYIYSTYPGNVVFLSDNTLGGQNKKVPAAC